MRIFASADRARQAASLKFATEQEKEQEVLLSWLAAIAGINLSYKFINLTC